MHTYLEGAGEVAQKSLEEEGAGSAEEEARRAGEAGALLVERRAAAGGAAGAARAAGAAAGAGACCRGLPAPEGAQQGEKSLLIPLLPQQGPPGAGSVTEQECGRA